MFVLSEVLQQLEDKTVYGGVVGLYIRVDQALKEWLPPQWAVSQALYYAK